MNAPASRRRARGLSLIEILVALAIAALLLLGLSQIYIGSKVAYIAQEGMSRTQENARFIFGFLDANVRMAGYRGCGNEADESLKFYNHLAVTPLFTQRFQRPIEGFDYAGCDASGCAATDGLELSSDAGTVATAGSEWSPPIDAAVLPPRPVKGSDVLVLRTLSAQSTPALGPFFGGSPDTTTANFTVAAVPGEPDFIRSGGVYAIANCAPRTDFFIASAGSAATNVVANSTDNQWRYPGVADSTWANTQADAAFNQPPLGQTPDTLNAEVHQANYMTIYVGLRPDGRTTALFVQRATGAGAVTAPEEIADNVESMQVTYGLSDGAGAFVPASQVDPAGAVPPLCVSDPAPAECKRDLNWRRVVSVHVALLMSGQDAAGVPGRRDASGNPSNVYTVGSAIDGSIGGSGAKLTRPADGRFRDVYEVTIALRNRLSSF